MQKDITQFLDLHCRQILIYVYIERKIGTSDLEGCKKIDKERLIDGQFQTKIDKSRTIDKYIEYRKTDGHLFQEECRIVDIQSL